MIAEEKSLADLVAMLTGCERIAIDTEADSLHCYFEKVCLIQISGGAEHVLIDLSLRSTCSRSTTSFARGVLFFTVRITICGFCAARESLSRLISLTR